MNRVSLIAETVGVIEVHRNASSLWVREMRSVVSATVCTEGEGVYTMEIENKGYVGQFAR